MSADTPSQDNKPENAEAAPGRSPDAQTGGQPDIQPGDQSGAGPAEQPDPAAREEQSGRSTGGPRAYVDPSIAAEATIAELEAKVAETQDRYVRSVAEADNLRKRTEREKADIAKYAVTKFAGDMVAIADNLRRAIAAASASSGEEVPSGALKALLEGVALTDQELQKALEKNGIRAIAADGEIFNPHQHQAVMEQDDPSVPAGTILQVFQDGYQIEDRVLRPAMVVVAKGGAKPVKSSDAAPNLGEAGAPPAANDSAAEQAGSSEQAGETPEASQAEAKPQ